jgi:hypothetical protein
MRYARLIWVNLRRSRIRTLLTTIGVAAALFLFVTLRSVLTTIDDAKQVGSESRMVTRNAISIVFSLPEAYYQKLTSIEGVKSVSWAAFFGGIYLDPSDFFPQFAIDAESYLAMYPELQIPEDQMEAFMAERTAALVGTGLMERFGWQLNQTIRLRGTIYRSGEEWPFTIRAVYTPSNPSFGDQLMYFHYDYLYEYSDRGARPGWFLLQLDDPSLAASVAETIDQHYKNSRYATRTETERAFQTSFFSMYGNISLILGAVGDDDVSARAYERDRRAEDGRVQRSPPLFAGDGRVHADHADRRPVRRTAREGDLRSLRVRRPGLPAGIRGEVEHGRRRPRHRSYDGLDQRRDSGRPDGAAAGGAHAAACGMRRHV